MAQVVWNDKEKMTDALTSEKYLTETYNSYTSETATPEVKSYFQNILCEEHDISYELFCEMNGRGWYPVDKADESKLQTVRNKFAVMA